MGATAMLPSDLDLPLAAFRRRLAAAGSATRCLLAWCEEHGIGRGPVTSHRRAPLPGAPDLARMLDAPGPPRHRSVTLMRGAVALSDCDVWWVDARLAPGMAATLDATDLPFGIVVAPLRPTRRLLLERPAAAPHLFEVQALLEADGRPFAAVREFYRAALLPAGGC